MHLLGRKRLAEQVQSLAAANAMQGFIPCEIGIRSPDDDLDFGVELPDPTNRFDAIESGRHAPVDESYGESLLLLQPAFDFDDRLFPLVNMHEFEFELRDRIRNRTHELGLELS